MFFLNWISYSQNSYQLKYWKEKNAFADLSDYYKKKYEKDTSNYIYLKELAVLEYRSRDFEKSIQHFNKYLKYNKIKDLYVFQLNGNANKIIGKYLEAKEQFKLGLFYSKKSRNKSYVTLFNREIESIDWAIKNSENKSNYHQTQVHKTENDYSIYNSNWVDSLIFLTKFKEDPFLISTELFNPITKKSTLIKHKLTSNRIGNFTKDENDRIYFSICDSNNNCKIGVGKLKYDSIIEIKFLKGLKYTDSTTYTMPFYFLNNSKPYLFYCSNNENSIGNLDIFYGELLTEDSIAQEQNISNINTQLDDVSPYFDEKSQTLYFSNSWMNGYGGLDIYKTNFVNLTSTMIENIGKPFNSSYNDLYFNIKDSIFTLTSNREKNKYCCNNYFHFTKNSREIFYIDSNKIIKDSSINLLSKNEIKKISELKFVDTLNLYTIDKLFPIKLYFHNDIPNPKSNDTITDTEYDLTYYDYLGLLDEYNTKNRFINTSEEIADFFKNEIPLGFKKLNELLDILTTEIDQDLKIKIYLKGFASPLASNTYNLKLSKRRISSIINYIQKYNNGILSKKIGNQIVFEFIPFGEEKADKNVNDNPRIKKKSIYSIEAAKERKIEFVEINISKY